MPRIVKSNGVHLTEKVFKIQDAMPRQGMARPGTHQKVDAEQATAQGISQDDAQNGFIHPMQGEIIQNAMTEASRILEQAVVEAQQQRNQILAQAQKEAEQLKQEALENGQRQGLASALGEIREITAGLEKAVADFEGERAGFEAEYAEHLKWFAVEIASKILVKKISQDDAILTEMVKKTIESVQNEVWIRVEVSKEMTNLLNRLQELYEGSETIKVVPGHLPPGSIQVETPAGVIDASVKTQIENLKEYFKHIK